MSSHHVIRENQEASVLVDEINESNQDVMNNAFEWSPIIVATENTFSWLNNFGYKVDALVCRPEFRAHYDQEINSQNPIEIIECDQEDEFISKGVTYIVEQKSGQAIIFSDKDYNRIFNDLNVPNELNITLIRNNYKYNLITNRSLDKWLPRELCLRIIPLGPGQSFVVNFPNGKSKDLVLGTLKEIEVQIEGIHKISSENPFIFGEPI